MLFVFQFWVLFMISYTTIAVKDISIQKKKVLFTFNRGLASTGFRTTWARFQTIKKKTINRDYHNTEHLIAELLCAEGARAEPHTLENLVIHRCQKFWLLGDCPYVRPSVYQINIYSIFHDYNCSVNFEKKKNDVLIKLLNLKKKKCPNKCPRYSKMSSVRTR